MYKDCPKNRATHLQRVLNIFYFHELVYRFFLESIKYKKYSIFILIMNDSINNMKSITEAGGIICPATPSFYSIPKTFEELASTVIARV